MSTQVVSMDKRRAHEITDPVKSMTNKKHSGPVHSKSLRGSNLFFCLCCLLTVLLQIQKEEENLLKFKCFSLANTFFRISHSLVPTGSVSARSC